MNILRSTLNEISCYDLPNWFSKIVFACFIAIGCIALSILLVTGIRNCYIPFFINEWPLNVYEGGQFIAAVRLLDAQSIYPLYEIYGDVTGYPPLTVILFAAGMYIFGTKVIVSKIIAFIACLFCFIGIGIVTYRFTKSKICIIISLIFFANLYSLSGYRYFDIRADIFCCALCVWGMYFAIKASFKENKFIFSVIATFLFTLSAYSKHNCLLFPVVYIIYCFIYRDYKLGIINLSVFAIVNLIFLLAFNIDGNYMISSLFVFGKQSLELAKVKNLFYYFNNYSSLIILLSFMAFFPYKDETQVIKRERYLLFSFWVVSFIAGMVPYIKVGGNTNNLMLLSVAISIAGASGIKKIMLFYPKSDYIHPSFLLIPILTTLLTLPPYISSFRRMNDNYQGTAIYEAQEVVNYLKNYNGKVYMPCYNYLTFIADKGYDVDDPSTYSRYLSEEEAPKNLTDKIKNKYFDQIIGGLFEQIVARIQNTEDSRELYRLLKKNYKELKPSPLKSWSVWVPIQD